MPSATHLALERLKTLQHQVVAAKREAHSLDQKEPLLNKAERVPH